MANPLFNKQVSQGYAPSPSSSKGKGKGFLASVNVKQAFTNGALPGKASNWYGAKGPVVKTYASSKGLC